MPAARKADPLVNDSLEINGRRALVSGDAGVACAADLGEPVAAHDEGAVIDWSASVADDDAGALKHGHGGPLSQD